METAINTLISPSTLPAKQQPAWAVAIRRQYGDYHSFSARFGPNVQQYCARNLARAIENDLPTFGQIIVAYGEEGVADIINTHITEAVLLMGEERDVDLYDVRFVSLAVCQSARLRVLHFSSIIGFFHHLKCGEFEIYGKVTPRKILEAFRKYAVRQQEVEERLIYEKECREREEERKRYAAEAVSWQQYARLAGLPDKDWASYIRRVRAEHP